MKIYIAKSQTWFDENSKVELIDDYRPQINAGLFCGFRKNKEDEEICNFDEFIIEDGE